LKRNSKPEVALGIEEEVDIRQQVINAIEKHISADLDAGKEYGIRPETILEDLDIKEQRRMGQY